MFSLFGLLWCAVDIVAVNRGFGLNTKQSIIAGMSLFAVQMIGALCVGVACSDCRTDCPPFFREQ